MKPKEKTSLSLGVFEDVEFDEITQKELFIEYYIEMIIIIIIII